jgi:alanyl-tRNA synthetase
MLLVRRCTKVRQDWRVEFACGRRAERIARNDFLLLRRAAERLSCAYDEVPDAAGRAVSERDAHFKDVRDMLQPLAEAEATLALQAVPPSPDGRRIISRAFPEDVHSEYLGHFAAQLAKSDKTIALLAGLSGGHLIFAQHPDAGADMNALLKQVLQQLGGKGGGTRDFARGRLSEPAKGEIALTLGRELLASQ